MKQRIILAGGTGFVGQTLAPFLLGKGFEIILLTRGSPREGAIRHVSWDGRTIAGWTGEIDGALAVINLTGRSLNCRHTPQNRAEIISSRVDSVRVLGQAIAACARPPQIFVQAAAVGIYGDKGDQWCDENAAHGDDFITAVCDKWEGAFNAIALPQTRKVLLRLGVVLGPNGGFLAVLAKLTRAFLGGQVGDGRQFISWIHIDDLARVFLSAIERADLNGVFNATAPNPVRNAEFMREMRRVLHRPWAPPAPKVAARIGSWIIGTQADLAFASQRVAPKRLIDSGFHWAFPELRPALARIYLKS